MAGKRVPVNHVGKRFGRLVVIAFSGRKDRSGRKRPVWRCKCDCGKTSLVVSGELTSGHTQSCGCRQREIASESNVIHGRTGTPEHRIWMHMIARCTNVTDKSYRNYGGRGIRVCRRWLKFANFIADMGSRPSDQHTIERKENDGQYEPSNCVWATRNIQARNKRTCRTVTFDGRKRLVIELAEEFGITPRNLRRRIDKGIPLGIALRKERLPSDWKSLLNPGPR